MPELITDTQADEAERQRQEAERRAQAGRVPVRMVDQDGGVSTVYLPPDDPLVKQAAGQTLVSTPTEEQKRETVRRVEERAKERDREAEQPTPTPAPKAPGAFESGITPERVAELKDTEAEKRETTQSAIATAHRGERPEPKTPGTGAKLSDVLKEAVTFGKIETPTFNTDDLRRRAHVEYERAEGKAEREREDYISTERERVLAAAGPSYDKLAADYQRERDASVEASIADAMSQAEHDYDAAADDADLNNERLTESKSEFMSRARGEQEKWGVEAKRQPVVGISKADFVKRVGDDMDSWVADTRAKPVLATSKRDFQESYTSEALAKAPKGGQLAKSVGVSMIPIYGTYQTIKTNGFVSGWTLVSAAGDILFVIPLVGTVGGAAVKGSVGAAKGVAVGQRLAVVGRTAGVVSKDLIVGTAKAPVELVRHPLQSAKAYGSAFKAGLKPSSWVGVAHLSTGSKGLSATDFAIAEEKVNQAVIRESAKLEEMAKPRVEIVQIEYKVGKGTVVKEVEVTRPSSQRVIRETLKPSGKGMLVRQKAYLESGRPEPESYTIRDIPSRGGIVDEGGVSPSLSQAMREGGQKPPPSRGAGGRGGAATQTAPHELTTPRHLRPDGGGIELIPAYGRPPTALPGRRPLQGIPAPSKGVPLITPEPRPGVSPAPIGTPGAAPAPGTPPMPSPGVSPVPGDLPTPRPAPAPMPQPELGPGDLPLPKRGPPPVKPEEWQPVKPGETYKEKPSETVSPGPQSVPTPGPAPAPEPQPQPAPAPAPQPQPVKTRVETRTGTPDKPKPPKPTPKPKLLPRLPGAEQGALGPYPDGTVAWKQGAVYAVWRPPYEPDQQMLTYQAERPVGVPIFRGPESAARSLTQIEAGKLPGQIDADLGFARIQLNQGQLQFSRRANPFRRKKVRF